MLPMVVAGGLHFLYVLAWMPQNKLVACIKTDWCSSIYADGTDAISAYSIADRPGLAPGLIGGLHSYKRAF